MGATASPSGEGPQLSEVFKTPPSYNFSHKRFFSSSGKTGGPKEWASAYDGGGSSVVMTTVDNSLHISMHCTHDCQFPRDK